MQVFLGVAGLLYLATAIAGLIGYVMNAWHFIQHLPVFDMLEVVRLIGIVVPLVGSILGYFV